MQRIGDGIAVRRLLIGAAVVLAALFLLLPLVAIFAQAFARGIDVFWANVTNHYTLAAIQLTLFIAVLTIPVCLVFGVALAWRKRETLPDDRAFLDDHRAHRRIRAGGAQRLPGQSQGSFHGRDQGTGGYLIQGFKISGF